VRERIVVPAEASEADIKTAALQAAAAHLEGREPKKVIVVRKQLVNIVV
jgi:leucyl-tRNA synthetase